MRNEILQGDVRERLADIPDGSVHCVVTSPPYWGLRDYGTATWEGGSAECDHIQRTNKHGGTSNRPGLESQTYEYRDTCTKCGARRIDSQLGLEPTPDEYVANMVAVFREVRRVLRDDGTVWLNLGDSYASGEVGRHDKVNGSNFTSQWQNQHRQQRKTETGLKPKDLVGIPWRVAFALQADGWWLRSDIIWSKPNPMPESVRDRPTKAHEYVFLLSKSERYYYDQDAVREKTGSEASWENYGGQSWHDHKNDLGAGQSQPKPHMANVTHPAGRNSRSVWKIATEPFPEAHFATFPTELAKRCILAGTSEHGVCSECGAPWERVTEKGLTAHDGDTGSGYEKGSTANRLAMLRQAARQRGGEYSNGAKTTGWRPTCDHEAPTVSALVLDPFFGSGTVGLVSARAGRDWLGIELNPEYVQMAEKRLAQVKARLL